MLEGIGTGILIGVALIGLTVLTGGADLVVIGAAVAAGGTVLSMGGKGFLQGTKQGATHVDKHGQVKTGSGNVTINGRAAAVACLSVIECDEHSGPQKLAQGSRTVTINGKMASRVGDRSVCDGVIGAGSSNVSIGGATGQCAAISKEVADWETGLAHDAVVVGTVAQIVGMILTGVGAVRAVAMAPAALRAMMMVRMGAGVAGGLGLGGVASHYAGQRYGEGSWQQEAAGTVAGLFGGFAGDAMASGGPRIIGGIKSSFEGAFEPGGMFGGHEFAPAGGPGGFGGGAGPEIVPHAPGSPGMDAWNPPNNDPLQMTGTGGSGGSGPPPNRLLSGEGDVGTYSDLNDAGSRGDNLTPHHMPSNKYMTENGPPGYTRDDGVSMNMEQPSPGSGGRHRLTASYGTDPDLAEYLDMSPRQALARDIADARQIYKDQGLYTPEIRQSLQQVIETNKTAWPGFFDK